MFRSVNPCFPPMKTHNPIAYVSKSGFIYSESYFTVSPRDSVARLCTRDANGELLTVCEISRKCVSRNGLKRLASRINRSWANRR